MVGMMGFYGFIYYHETVGVQVVRAVYCMSCIFDHNEKYEYTGKGHFTSSKIENQERP